MAQVLELKKPHARVTGDYGTAVKKIDKNGWTKVLNTDIPKTFENIPIYKLELLETQRNAKSDWAVERLKARGGIDMLALGVLCVARDPKTKINYVWDGAGRWLLCEAMGYKGDLPCMVYEINRETAAYYFSYNQDEGKRTLSKEATFVNRYFSKLDTEAQRIGDLLDHLGLYIKGDTGVCVPHDPKRPNTAEIRYRAVVEGDKFADGDRNVQRMARDMIYTAYALNGQNFDKVVQDFYWAVLKLLISFTNLQSGKNYRQFQDYITWRLKGSKEGNIVNEWKGAAKGTQANSKGAVLMAASMLEDLQSSNFTTNAITRLDPLKIK